MGVWTPVNYTPVIICIAIIAFAGAFLTFLKTALSHCRRARLHLLAETGGKKYSRAIKLLEKSSYYQASLRTGIIFLEILLGCFGGFIIFDSLVKSGPLIAGWINPLTEILAFMIFSALGCALFFVLAEVIPAAIARSAPEKITASFSRFILVLAVLGYPLLAVEKVVSSVIRRFFPGDESNPGMTEDELHIALLEGEKSGIVESKERTMVEGVFYLGDKPAGTFMTHRSEIEWLDINADEEKTRSIAEDTEQQYFPVAEGDLDKVCGIVSVRNLLQALLTKPWPGLKSLIQTPCFVPETMPALKAFETFKKADTNCLFVMDEYGGFAGILTVRNLVEEIVGQLAETTGDDEEIVRLENGSWLIDGLINIDTVAEAVSLASLSEDADHSDYHTLAGFILNLAGEIPCTGASFDYNGFRFTVADMDGNRIDKVLIEKLEPCEQ